MYRYCTAKHVHINCTNANGLFCDERCSEVSASSDSSNKRSQWSGSETVLVQRSSSTSHANVPHHDFNEYQMMRGGRDSETQRSSINDWTPFVPCGLDCVQGQSKLLEGGSLWNSRRRPQTVKRQLDLNIVLSNYIKHRLGKDD